MIPCNCDACDVLDPFDRETELDEMVLSGTDLIPWIIFTETERFLAANPYGYVITRETHEV